METTDKSSSSKDDKLIIDQKYYITGKIGQGSFGSLSFCYNFVKLGIIYKAQQLDENKENVAIKIEKKAASSHSHQQSMLQREIELLKLFENKLGFPRIYNSGRTPQQQNYLVMQYLGLNLGVLLKKCDGKFSILTVAMIGFQMIERLEDMHNQFYLHRDLKPENFLIGLGVDYGVIFIIDFGLSKLYIDQKTKNHIELRDKKGLVGTARYVSIPTHQGYEQGRRDDLESLAYLLIFFAYGNLP